MHISRWLIVAEFNKFDCFSPTELGKLRWCSSCCVSLCHFVVVCEFNLLAWKWALGASKNKCYTLFVQIYSLLIPSHFIDVQFYRPKSWETLRGDATGWELLSHFSAVWPSSSSQPTRGSHSQPGNLFRYQIKPWWM
jgi:hypothetical protein